jgi:hypothetical protein
VGSSGVKFIPTGGLFVTGGLTPKNIQFIEGQDSPFMMAYHDKGRVKPILEHVPIFAVMTEDLGVRGAHKSAQMVSLCFINEMKKKETPGSLLLIVSFLVVVLLAAGVRKVCRRGSYNFSQ